MNKVRPCPCGSGKGSYWQNDARGIPLCRTCDDCHEKRMAGYRPEVLTDANYEADEDIESDPEIGGHCNHSWVETGTAYGGDDPRYHGEGRSYCEFCGADGDA